MGFSGSLLFVQMTNKKIMSSCLGAAGSHIMNSRTLPAMFTAGNGQKEATGSHHFVFVDNLGYASTLVFAPRYHHRIDCDRVNPTLWLHKC